MFEAYLLLTAQNSDGFLPKFISTRGKNNERIIVNNILLKLEQGIPLLEIVKRYNASNVTLSAPLKRFIESVIEKTTVLKPSQGKEESGKEEVGDEAQAEVTLLSAVGMSLN